ncbi:MAG: phage portal protein [Alphaproteobacteria bacterium]
MLNALRNLLRAPEQKASRTSQLIALQSAGQARWTPRDYAALTRAGYVQNAIVYRAVKLVAENVGGASFVVEEGGATRDTHPLLDLLARPNPRQDRASFIEAIATHLLLAGNAYVEAVSVEAAPRELYALRPDRMKLVPGADGWPEAYEYTVAGRSVRFDQSAALPPVLHLTLLHPLDDHYGLAPLEAAAVAVDTHNAAAKWNKALLDNAARPCGALVFSNAEGAVIADDQFQRLKRELDEEYAGARNAGRPLLLEGGLDWKAMSLSPKDMDFMEAKHTAAREIALAFGVPPQLLGIPGDNTFSNYQEANRVFFRATVLPFANRIACALSAWLGSAFGEVRLAVDADQIDALASDRAALWSRISDAPFLTLNEKRAAVGYAALEGGDRLE